MAFKLTSYHAHRWHGAIAVAGARDGAASLLAAGGVRSAHRHTGAAEYLVQSGWRTNRQSRCGRLLDVFALWDRCAGGGPDQSNEAFICAAEGGSACLRSVAKSSAGLLCSAAHSDQWPSSRAVSGVVIRIAVGWYRWQSFSV